MQGFIFSTLLGVSVFLGSVDVQAQAKAKPKAPAGKAALTITSATSRSFISGSGEHPHSDIRIALVWKSATPPQDIYYRQDAAHWLKCKITSPQQRPFGGGPNDYMVVEMRTAPAAMKAGGTYNLTPEEIPSDVQPEAVKKMPAGAIFYKLQGSNTWQYVKANMKKLPDVKRP
jgi:hypothetical protein